MKTVDNYRKILNIHTVLFLIFAMSSFYILVCYLGLFLFDKYEIYPKYNAKEFNYALNILFFSYISEIL